jgi:hypothetical protein
VRGPQLTDLVAVTPEAVPGKTHTAAEPLFSSGAETATCPPTTAVRLPNRSPFSAVPGTPAVLWLKTWTLVPERPVELPLRTAKVPASVRPARSSPGTPVTTSA